MGARSQGGANRGTQNRLIGEFTQDLRRYYPVQLPSSVRGRVLEACDASFFQRREHPARARQLRNHEVEMRRVAKTHRLFCPKAQDFLYSLGGIARWFQSFDDRHIGGRKSERFGEDFRGLGRADIRAGDQCVGFHAERAQAERRGTGFLNASCRQWPVWFRWAFWVGTIHGDSVPDNVEDHELRNFLFSLSAPKLGLEVEFLLKQVCLSLQAREIQSHAIGGAD